MTTQTPMTDALCGPGWPGPSKTIALADLARKLETDRAALIAALEPMARCGCIFSCVARAALAKVRD